MPDLVHAVSRSASIATRRAASGVNVSECGTMAFTSHDAVAASRERLEDEGIRYAVAGARTVEVRRSGDRRTRLPALTSSISALAICARIPLSCCRARTAFAPSWNVYSSVHVDVVEEDQLGLCLFAGLDSLCHDPRTEFFPGRRSHLSPTGDRPVSRPIRRQRSVEDRRGNPRIPPRRQPAGGYAPLSGTVDFFQRGVRQVHCRSRRRHQGSPSGSSEFIVVLRYRRCSYRSSSPHRPAPCRRPMAFTRSATSSSSCRRTVRSIVTSVRFRVPMAFRCAMACRTSAFRTR